MRSKAESESSQEDKNKGDHPLHKGDHPLHRPLIPIDLKTLREFPEPGKIT